MFGRKKEKTEVIKKATDISEEVVHESPQICMYDMEDSIFDAFKSGSYNCTKGTIGNLIQVPNHERGQEHLLSLNYSSPENLHEYDVLIFDMGNNQKVEYDKDKKSFENITGKSVYRLLSEYPEKVFNPKPYGTRIISKEINEILKKKSIVIIFSSRPEIVSYQEVEVGSYKSQVTNLHDIINTCFYDGFPDASSKSGQKMKAPVKQAKLTSILLKYADNSSYESIFSHPTHWEKSGYENDENFIPLLLNNDDEIISFCHFYSEGSVLVFPQVSNKKDFLLELFNNHLTEIFPEVFPFHGQFGWLDNGDYPLPGESDLLLQRSEIEEKYISDVDENEKYLHDLKDEFSFLRELVSESGDNLVSAVEAYLKWLGFESVVNFDDTNPEILEEDLQVDCGDRFLVVEVKGIGGTSTDKDCSQISKIRYRRAEERGKFDVFGLYIVNHQRYIPPKARNNPPFTENQIKDAGHDKRGILTTYDLYKAYFLIEDGIINKEHVREKLFETGLISLTPEHIISLGTPTEYFKNGQVAILTLDGTQIKIGDTVFVRKEGEYSKREVVSIMVDDLEVGEASSGEVGIRFNKKIKKNSELFA